MLTHQPTGATQFRLSKSGVCDGLQCHKFLSWRVHEPDAPELDLDDDPATRSRLEQGTEIGAFARNYAGPDEMIDVPRDRIEQKLEATGGRILRVIEDLSARLNAEQPKPVPAEPPPAKEPAPQ